MAVRSTGVRVVRRQWQWDLPVSEESGANGNAVHYLYYCFVCSPRHCTLSQPLYHVCESSRELAQSLLPCMR
jgi:hypothetical protein